MLLTKQVKLRMNLRIEGKNELIKQVSSHAHDNTADYDLHSDFVISPSQLIYKSNLV